MAITLAGLVGRTITKQAEESTYRAYRVLLHGIIVLLLMTHRIFAARH